MKDFSQGLFQALAHAQLCMVLSVQDAENLAVIVALSASLGDAQKPILLDFPYSELVFTVRLILDYLLDSKVAIHSCVFILDFSWGIDLEMSHLLIDFSFMIVSTFKQ
jgi:hypothetical protein